MSESKFDPRKFAQYKFKSAEPLRNVLKADKSKEPKPQVQEPAPQVQAKPFQIQESVPQLQGSAPQIQLKAPQVQEKPTLVQEKAIEKAVEAKKPNRLQFAFQILIIAVIAFIIALLIRTFVVQTVYIATSAMEPGLRAGDRVLINRLAYELLGNKKPSRGEIVVLVQMDGSYQVKRVVGLSGENVKIVKGQLYINGRALKETYPILKGNVGSEQVRVMRGSYYVLGDNREKSLDSRDYGAIPKTRIIGKVLMRIWPLNKITTFK